MDHYCFELKTEKLKAEANELKPEEQQKWLKAGGFTIVRGKPLGLSKRLKAHT